MTHFRSHPWHGLSIGDDAPYTVNCYIEMTPTDTIKYELDKETGLLKVDRPQKFSSLCPTLYGFLPRTYSGDKTAAHCMERSGLKNIVGDSDPVDICVLTENVIPRGDIILKAIPIGGFRMIDHDEADDKIIAVLADDFVFGTFKEISECPKKIIERLRHYFLTYKGLPSDEQTLVQITDTFDAEEARKIISLGLEDYVSHYSNGDFCRK